MKSPSERIEKVWRDAPIDEKDAINDLLFHLDVDFIAGSRIATLYEESYKEDR